MQANQQSAQIPKYCLGRIQQGRCLPFPEVLVDRNWDLGEIDTGMQGPDQGNHKRPGELVQYTKKTKNRATDLLVAIERLLPRGEREKELSQGSENQSTRNQKRKDQRGIKAEADQLKSCLGTCSKKTSARGRVLATVNLLESNPCRQVYPQ